VDTVSDPEKANIILKDFNFDQGAEQLSPQKRGASIFYYYFPS
jgi:hypothetical protein